MIIIFTPFRCIHSISFLQVFRSEEKPQGQIWSSKFFMDDNKRGKKSRDEKSSKVSFIFAWDLIIIVSFFVLRSFGQRKKRGKKSPFFILFLSLFFLQFLPVFSSLNLSFFSFCRLKSSKVVVVGALYVPIRKFTSTSKSTNQPTDRPSKYKNIFR